MVRVLSVIGTRPQYIKFKPIYVTFARHNIEHVVVDTCQHYSPSVSESIIKDLGLKIDHFLEINNTSEIDFLAQCILKVTSLLERIKPDLVLVLGDTNTTFCASIAAYKMGIKLAHVESGERSEARIPELVNRVYCDLVSDIHFCSAKSHMKNVSNPILTGDLEYELLHSYDPAISYGDYAVLTVHRQENMDTVRLKSILRFLSNIDLTIKFPIHHRTKNFIKKNDLQIPSNIIVENPYDYSTMVRCLAGCKFVITDSGGVHKCSPFFGKKSLILRPRFTNWAKTYEKGFSLRYTGKKGEIEWLNDYKIERDKHFYLPVAKMPSEIIAENI